MWKLFVRAGREYEREQYVDARRTLAPLVESNPQIIDLSELLGITLYRLGHWSEAIEVLEDVRARSGSAEQNHVLMDCHRALGNWADVDELWVELGDHSPSAELVIEGRIVRAGAAADRGRVDEAVRILEKGWKTPKDPQPWHLRRAYALADMLERDGSLQRSRRIFEWIDGAAPGFSDADERVAALR